jgi:hypothetical protein
VRRDDLITVFSFQSNAAASTPKVTVAIYAMKTLISFANLGTQTDNQPSAVAQTKKAWKRPVVLERSRGLTRTDIDNFVSGVP